MITEPNSITDQEFALFQRLIYKIAAIALSDEIIKKYRRSTTFRVCAASSSGEEAYTLTRRASISPGVISKSCREAESPGINRKP